MKHFMSFFSVAILTITPAFAQLNDPSILGPVVSGKAEGSHTTTYIPFSKSAGHPPVLATEEYVDNIDKGVPFDEALRLIDRKPAYAGEPCRKGDIHIASEDANQYLYFCVGNLWRIMKLELW